jgi:hypothetical protein
VRHPPECGAVTSTRNPAPAGPVARAKVDHRSRAAFSMRLAHRYRARVVLTLADGATQLALTVGPR